MKTRLARALWVMAKYLPTREVPRFRVKHTEHGDMLEDIYR